MGFRVASSFKRMKRIVYLSLLLLLAGAFSALAQDRKHDVTITLGGPVGGGFRFSEEVYRSGNDLYSLYKNAENYTPAGGLILGYTYRLSDQFTVGGDAGFGVYEMTVEPGYAARNRESYSYDAVAFTIMPIAEWYYYRDDAADFYMRAGFGAQIATGDYYGTRLFPSWQLTPIGVHVGSKAYFIGELGIGTEYILRIGVGFRF